MAVISKPSFSDLGESQRWDAECFAPNLRTLDARFAKFPLLTKLASVTHPAEIARVYCDTKQGVPFIRAQNIRPLLPEMTDVAQISSEVASVLTVNRLETNDVLVTRSGAYSGVATVYLGASGKCYTSGEGIIVRSLGDIDGAYLVAFFNTLPGSALCRRAIYGSGQPHIGPKYLERIRVPRIGTVEAQAAQLIREAHNQIEATKNAYTEAEAELLERLGWADLHNQPRELCFSTRFSNLFSAARNDAERFHPNVARVRHFLTKKRAEDIATVCEFVKHGLQPPYFDNGNIGIVSQRQFTGSGLDLDSLENFTNDDFCKQNPDFRIRKSDVLTYCVSAGEYLGRTYLFGSDRPCVAASFVTILRTTKLVPGYLALFLNSPFGLTQSNGFKRGTSPFYLYPRDLKNVLVYVPRNKSGEIDQAWQEKLAAKVEASTRAREQAKTKLAEAKKLVEDALSNC